MLTDSSGNMIIKTKRSVDMVCHLVEHHCLLLWIIDILQKWRGFAGSRTTHVLMVIDNCLPVSVMFVTFLSFLEYQDGDSQFKNYHQKVISILLVHATQPRSCWNVVGKNNSVLF